MTSRNPAVDETFRKAENWREEADRLREIILDCGLGEELKWGQPCYTFEGRNVVLIQRMKEFLALLFFKGGVLADPDGILEPPGPNSRIGRRIPFTRLQDIVDREGSVRAYIRAAIEADRAGLSVEKETMLDLPEELRSRLDGDAALQAAFDGLTPGRQRAYALHVAGAKQSATRMARVERHVPTILAGKGPNDR